MTPEQYTKALGDLRLVESFIRTEMNAKVNANQREQIAVAQDFLGIAPDDEFEMKKINEWKEIKDKEFSGPYKVVRFAANWQGVVMTYRFRRKDGTWSEQQKTVKVRPDTEVRRLP